MDAMVGSSLIHEFSLTERRCAPCVRLSAVSLVQAILLACIGVPACAQTCVANVQASTPTANFVANGNGTVTDRKTGLMWDQCAWGSSGSACAVGTNATMTWQAALGVAATANGMAYKGYSDWRLPNVKELLSIVETCRSSPSINEQIFPNTISNVFWSGSPDVLTSSYAWVVDFGSGYSPGGNRDGVSYVRLVRVGQ